MNRHVCRLAGALAIAVAIAGSPPASAGHGTSRVLKSVAVKPMPEGVAILVRTLDDTESNLAIKAGIEEALVARGFVVGDDPRGIVLSFESHSLQSCRKGAPRRTFVELGGGKGPDTGPGGARKGGGAMGTVRLFDSRKGAVFDKVDHGIEEPVETLVRLDVDIDNRGNGKALWTAWAVANQADGGPIAPAKAMVPAIIDAIGKTVKEQTVASFPSHGR